jgi:hypothetical protein
MEEFLDSIRKAMGDETPHIISATLDRQTWALADHPHTWQRVEQSKDGSVSVWLDTAYDYIAVQYEHEGHACFSVSHVTIVTPDFVVINRRMYPEAQCYIWRPEA